MGNSELVDMFSDMYSIIFCITAAIAVGVFIVAWAIKTIGRKGE